MSWRRLRGPATPLTGPLGPPFEGWLTDPEGSDKNVVVSQTRVFLLDDHERGRRIRLHKAGDLHRANPAGLEPEDLGGLLRTTGVEVLAVAERLASDKKGRRVLQNALEQLDGVAVIIGLNGTAGLQIEGLHVRGEVRFGDFRHGAKLRGFCKFPGVSGVLRDKLRPVPGFWQVPEHKGPQNACLRPL